MRSQLYKEYKLQWGQTQNEDNEVKLKVSTIRGHIYKEYNWKIQILVSIFFIKLQRTSTMKNQIQKEYYI